MDFFPAFLKLDGKSVLIVGGGSIAARKARLLRRAGARITVVTPRMSAALETLIAGDGHVHLKRGFEARDVEGHWLVVSATGEARVETEVARAAARAGIFCNTVDRLDRSSFITPAIVDRSPIVVAVSSAGTAPVLARRVRAQIETLLPARLGELAAFAGRWRRRVARRLTRFQSRLRFWEAFFDGESGEAVLAGRRADAERITAGLLRDAQSSARNRGIGFLVGAGPGDPELLTLRALRVLQLADVIFHDRLVSDEVLALARRDAEFVPVGKAPGRRTMEQDDINRLLVERVAAGERVCRLKGGDPFIFGRGGEEAAALAAHGLACEIVPGVTAASGCAAVAGIPLTHRDLAQSVIFLTAHGKGSVDRLDWRSLARHRQTLAVYMGVARFRTIMQKLTAHGRGADTPVAIVERGTLPGQRVIRGTLGQLPMLAAAEGVQAPALLIIGEVAALGAGEAGATLTPHAPGLSLPGGRICYTDELIAAE